ncbi:MAG: FG-GAP-like repeat-containing protein [Acidobacteriota bacterium]
MSPEPRRAAPFAAALAFALLLGSAGAVAAPPSPEAMQLRDDAFAELENEAPERATALYASLIELVPGDPLPHANLAIAHLRRQQYDDAGSAIERALALAPNRPDLLAIEAEILQWSGQDLAGALSRLEQAVAADPDDLERLFALHQLATTNRAALDEAAADAAADRALDRLVALRPENLVLLLAQGQRAIARDDRTAATGAFQRIGELVWQAPELAQRAHAGVIDALSAAGGDDLDGVRVPALRLENVLKVTPMYRESLRELRTGIQGIPVRNFVDEPSPTVFGAPKPLTFVGAVIDPRPTAGRALAIADFDGDAKPDVARVRAASGDAGAALELRFAAKDWQNPTELPARDDLTTLRAADLDNDGRMDLVGAGPAGALAWRGLEDGGFAAFDDQLGLGALAADALVGIDFDIEGDLDLAAVARDGRVTLWRNALDGPLDDVTADALPAASAPAPGAAAAGTAADLAASDLDRDGDLDLIAAGPGGLVWLDNLRQGRFAARADDALAAVAGAHRALVAADYDGDGRPDVVTAGDDGVIALRGQDDGSFRRWPLAGLPSAAAHDLIALDADNDGRLDLAIAGVDGVTVLTRRARIAMIAQTIEQGPASATALATDDLDGDGDLDLIAAGPDGLVQLRNDGGNANGWLRVSLRGLTRGSSKNNVFGVGAVVEVRAGTAYQFREAEGDIVHLGLGDQATAETLRVVWTNGVPQNRLDVAGEQRLVEEQLLKGSCPFVYVWNGREFVFLTDLLWGAPLGLPAGPDAWIASNPEELVRLDGLVATEDGRYPLRITEELWEAAFFDLVRLWVVDHPIGVEVASDLRIVPDPNAPAHAPQPGRVLATRDLRPLARAVDGRGADVTARVATRDEVYADGYARSPYQGVAAAPWTFTLDLGTAPNGPIRLHLDGWIFPADASLNLATAQAAWPYVPPRLEVETADGTWQTLMPAMGFPPGKTKTMVVDTPPLPPGARTLRIVSNLWLHWDRIAWAPDANRVDDRPIVQARLRSDDAVLRWRGFSKPVRHAPNGPHAFDYQTVQAISPWGPALPGRYTRFGAVDALLDAPDDRSVILAPGDEIALSFDASALPPVAEGWQRTLFLESHGWDKDADRNTGEGLQLGPLPFRAMQAYPYAEGESFPDTPALRDYRQQWLTRAIGVDDARAEADASDDDGAGGSKR